MIGERLIARVLNLDQVDSIDRIDVALEAPWARSIAPLLIAVVVAAVVATLFYVRWQPRRKKAVSTLLAVCRAGILILVLLALAEPTLVVHSVVRPRPQVWILVDESQSMNLADSLSSSEREALSAAVGGSHSAVSEATRMEWVQALLSKRDRNLLEELQEKHRVSVFGFNVPEALRPFPADPVTRVASGTRISQELTADGESTALGSALARLARQPSAGPLAGVIVVSDFDQNSGPPAAEAARRLGAPIYTVGVGPASTIDVSVAVQAPLLMKKDEQALVSVEVRQSGLDNAVIELELLARRWSPEREEPSEQSVGKRRITLSGAIATIEFPYVPRETGRVDLLARVAEQPGEKVIENNRADRTATVRDDFLRLLFVEYEPTWEWRFIKEVFYRDRLVGSRGFRTFLSTAEPKVRQSSELFLPTPAPQRRDFFAYDVIVLGDVPTEALSQRFCDMTREFVSQFGGGLVVISGKNFSPHSLAASPLAEMLPVVIDPRGRRRDTAEFTPRLSPEASRVDFSQLARGAAANAKAWSQLEGLDWYQPAERVHPLATVLMEHPTDLCADGRTPQPLMALRRFGRGEVVYLAFNETWRLRRGMGEMNYRKFWGQLIHRLGFSHALGEQKRFVLRTDRTQYQVDEQVIVTIEAYDENFEPLATDKLPDGKLTARLIRAADPRAGASAPAADAPEVTLTETRPGVYEGRLPLVAAGEFQLRAIDPLGGPAADARLRVADASVENRSVVRNVALQEELSRATGGQAYDLTTVHRLPSEIKLSVQAATRSLRVNVWNTWPVFGLIVGMMLCEWALRRWMDLP